MEDGIKEKCVATIEQTSPHHGARYWQKVDYGSLAKAISHNDLFQRACCFYNTSEHIALTLSRMEKI